MRFQGININWENNGILPKIRRKLTNEKNLECVIDTKQTYYDPRRYIAYIQITKVLRVNNAETRLKTSNIFLFLRKNQTFRGPGEQTEPLLLFTE